MQVVLYIICRHYKFHTVLPSNGNAYTYCTLYILICILYSFFRKALTKKNHKFFEDTEQTKLQGPVTHLLLLNKRYNSCRVLAFSSIFFHSLRSWACSDHLRSFILLRSFLTSSSHYVQVFLLVELHMVTIYIFSLQCLFPVFYVRVQTSSIFGL